MFAMFYRNSRVGSFAFCVVFGTILGCSIPFKSDSGEGNQVVGNVSPPGKVDEEFDTGNLSKRWLELAPSALGLLYTNSPTSALPQTSSESCVAVPIALDLVVTSSQCAKLCNGGSVLFSKEGVLPVTEDSPLTQTSYSFSCTTVEKSSTQPHKSFALLRMEDTSSDGKAKLKESIKFSEDLPPNTLGLRLLWATMEATAPKLFVSTICEVKAPSNWRKDQPLQQPATTSCTPAAAREISWSLGKAKLKPPVKETLAAPLGSPIVNNATGDIVGILESAENGVLQVTLAADILSQ